METQQSSNNMYYICAVAALPCPVHPTLLSLSRSLWMRLLRLRRRRRLRRRLLRYLTPSAQRQAEDKLRDCPQGTFLIRFSDRYPGWLALAFVDSTTMGAAGSPNPNDDDAGERVGRGGEVSFTHCLVDVRDGSFCVFFATHSLAYVDVDCVCVCV